MDAVICFSAQFGGRDAANAVLPHLRALKSAATEIRIRDFAAPDLTFILRVDGEVRTFGESGPSSIDIDKQGDYVSVDIVLSRDDRDLLGSNKIRNPIASHLLDSTRLIAARLDLSKDSISELNKAISMLSERYTESLGEAP